MPEHLLFCHPIVSVIPSKFFRPRRSCTTSLKTAALLIWDIVEGMPNFLEVTWPRPRPFEKYYTPLLWVESRRSCVPNLKLIRQSITDIWHFYARYVTLHYVILACDPLYLNGYREFVVMWSNRLPNLSILRRSYLELWCLQSGCYWQFK